MKTVLIATDHHFTIDRHGAIALPKIIPSTYYDRYLSVFDHVAVVARATLVDTLDPDIEPLGPNVSLVSLPDWHGPWEFIRLYPYVRSVLRRIYQDDYSYIFRVPGLVATAASWEAKKRGLPFSVEVAGDPGISLGKGAIESRFRSIYRLVYRLLLNFQISHASCVAFVTEDVLQKRYRTAENAFVTNYSSIDLRDEAFSIEPRRFINALSAPRLISVASLNQPYKGVDVLIDALRRCRDSHLDAHLMIVGDGILRQRLESYADEIGVSNFVEFVGEVSAGRAVRDCMNRGDIFVLASCAEGLPRALIEAMAQGLPCIATAVGGIPELLPASALVTAGDASSLATRVVEYCGNPDRMTQAARENHAEAAKFSAHILNERRNVFYRNVDRSRERIIRGSKIYGRIRARIWQQIRWAIPVWLLTLVTEVLPDNKVGISIRGALLRPFIMNAGTGFQVGRGVTLLNTDKLSIGDNVYLARGTWINGLGGVRIADEVVFGPYVTISSLRHEFKDNLVRFGGSTAGSVDIGRGTWLASHVSVAMGAVIGSGVLVAANSAVVGAIPSDVIAGGVPARVLRERVHAPSESKNRSDLLGL